MTPTTIHDLFQTQTGQTLNAPAIIAPGRTALTYGRLKQRLALLNSNQY